MRRHREAQPHHHPKSSASPTVDELPYAGEIDDGVEIMVISLAVPLRMVPPSRYFLCRQLDEIRSPLSSSAESFRDGNFTGRGRGALASSFSSVLFPAPTMMPKASPRLTPKLTHRAAPRTHAGAKRRRTAPPGPPAPRRHGPGGSDTVWKRDRGVRSTSRRTRSDEVRHRRFPVFEKQVGQRQQHQSDHRSFHER